MIRTGKNFCSGFLELPNYHDQTVDVNLNIPYIEDKAAKRGRVDFDCTTVDMYMYMTVYVIHVYVH